MIKGKSNSNEIHVENDSNIIINDNKHLENYVKKCK